MNLEDVIDPEYGLQQDDWSLSKPRFGDEGHLEVVGWSGKSRRHKKYIFKCSVCSEDEELFGQAYFKSNRSDAIRGQIPCGCAYNPRWSKDQYEVLCSRKAKELGYTFRGFVGEWRHRNTKVNMFCESHGSWDTITIANLLHRDNRCPGCRNKKPDDVMIASFFASGAFHPDTKFWRSERKTKQGRKEYWYMSCPVCKEVVESYGKSLQRGSLACACSRLRQQEGYINFIIDVDTPVAIKFGVARDSKQRIKQQDVLSIYTIKQHSVYCFPSVASCKAAERECKKELECGVVLKRDMLDGWSETTWLYNLDKIVEIYERNGGILIS